MSRTDYLNDLIPAIESRSGTFVEFRPFKGWWLDNYDYPRYLGDEGDYIGRNWREAEQCLRRVFKERMHGSR